MSMLLTQKKLKFICLIVFVFQHEGTSLLNFVSGYPSWHEYLESMAKDGTWGDHVVLFAAANHFQTPICIISSLDHEIVVQPDHALANTNPLVLGHIHELHYVSLQPRQGKTFFPITNILVFFFWTCGNYVCGIYIHMAISRQVVGKNVKKYGI